MRQVTHGSADQSVYLQFLDAAGLPLDPAPTSASGGIDVWYRRQGGLKVSLSLADLSAVNDSHSDGGMIHIAGGVVRVDFPDAAFSSGASEVLFGGAIDDGVVVKESIGLIGFDNQAAYVPSLASNMRGTDGAYTGTPDSAATIAASVRVNLATELARIDESVSAAKFLANVYDSSRVDQGAYSSVKVWPTDDRWVYSLSGDDLPDPTASGLIRVMDATGFTTGFYERTAFQAAYNTGADGIQAMVQLDVSPGAGGTTGGRVRVLSTSPESPLGNIVFDGNSLTAGTSGHIEFVRQSLLMGGFDNRWDWANKGVGAQTTQDMIDDAAATVDILVDGVRYPRGNILVAWEVTNDLYFGADAETAYARFKAYCQARRAAGWKVIALDVLPRSDAGAPATFEADRATVNGWMADEWTLFADAFIPISNQSRLSDETDATYYAGDNVHLSTAGHALVAAEIWPAVERSSRSGVHAFASNMRGTDDAAALAEITDAILGGDQSPIIVTAGVVSASTTTEVDEDAIAAAVVASIGSVNGTGATKHIETVLVDGDPVPGVDVWVTLQGDTSVVVAGTKVTDAAGEVWFMLDKNVDYYVNYQKSGLEFPASPNELRL